MAADGRSARDDLAYSWEQIEAALRFGFETCVAAPPCDYRPDRNSAYHAPPPPPHPFPPFHPRSAQSRGKALTVVDKANVLETSRLWRRVAAALAPAYADVRVEYMYVDNCAMQLVTRPAAFDVIVTENLFGDILSDEASVLPGSLGLMPSASLTTNAPSLSGSGRSRRLHLFEPIGGTAPDIAGRGVANPIAQILSAALLLRYGLGLEAEARAVEAAVDAVLADGYRTGDLVGRGAAPREGDKLVGTAGMGDAIVAAIAAAAAKK